MAGDAQWYRAERGLIGGLRDLRFAGMVPERWPSVRTDGSGAGCISGSTALQSVLSAYAGVAQLVERHVANVQVDGSSPFTRSTFRFSARASSSRGFLVNFRLPGGYDRIG